MKKSVVLILAVFMVSGCSSKMAHSSWNMGMSIIAPGSYYTAVNSGRQIIDKVVENER